MDIDSFIMCDEEDIITEEEAKCLEERKWWCFLLSSICTFLAGLGIVLVWRALSFVCCRKDSGEYSAAAGGQDPKKVGDQLIQVGPGGAIPGPPPGSRPGRQPREEFEGTFMTEAKDWAGELISGQTTTGRILVSPVILFVSKSNEQFQKTTSDLLIKNLFAHLKKQQIMQA